MSDARVRQIQRQLTLGEIDAVDYFRRMLRWGVICVGARVDVNRGWGGLSPGTWEIDGLNEKDVALELRRVGKRGRVLARRQGQWYRFRATRFTAPEVLARLEASVVSQTTEQAQRVSRERRRQTLEAKRKLNSVYREFYIRERICDCKHHYDGCKSWKVRIAAVVVAKSKQKAKNAFKRFNPEADFSPGPFLALDAVHDNLEFYCVRNKPTAGVPRIRGN